ncbi:MAG TPA: hypothetical protein VJ697_08785 [Nitrososphaeraceae archaeon]|nr:hypothetical protein [Nitrososphaeraceae archaeon]
MDLVKEAASKYGIDEVYGEKAYYNREIILTYLTIRLMQNRQ